MCAPKNIIYLALFIQNRTNNESSVMSLFFDLNVFSSVLQKSSERDLKMSLQCVCVCACLSVCIFLQAPAQAVLYPDGTLHLNKNGR